MRSRTEDTVAPPPDANLLRTIGRLKLRVRLLGRLVRDFERLRALRGMDGAKPSVKAPKTKGA